jgi:hypothetical protein
MGKLSTFNPDRPRRIVPTHGELARERIGAQAASKEVVAFEDLVQALEEQWRSAGSIGAEA